MVIGPMLKPLFHLVFVEFLGPKLFTKGGLRVETGVTLQQVDESADAVEALFRRIAYAAWNGRRDLIHFSRFKLFQTHSCIIVERNEQHTHVRVALLEPVCNLCQRSCLTPS